MPKDKKDHDEYPKISGKDKRWKEQDEFDSAGQLRQQDDEDKNASIPKTSIANDTDGRGENAQG